MKQHILPISILLEAKLLYFGDKPKRSRHKENVMERQAFANAFVSRAKSVDIAAVLNKHHATITHYKKNHDSDIKYSEGYKEAFARAMAVREQYDPKVVETEYSEFVGFDNARLLILVKELKNRVNAQEIIIDEQRKEMNALSIENSKLSNEIEDIRSTMAFLAKTI